MQKCFTMGGFLLELISEQFNVHGFQASPWYLAEMITTKQGTRRESSTIAKTKIKRNKHSQTGYVFSKYYENTMNSETGFDVNGFNCLLRETLSPFITLNGINERIMKPSDKKKGWYNSLINELNSLFKQFGALNTPLVMNILVPTISKVEVFGGQRYSNN